MCVCVRGRGVNNANFIKEILYIASSLYVKVGKPLKMKKKIDDPEREREFTREKI